MEQAVGMAAESAVVSRAVAAKTTRQGKRAPVLIDKRLAIGRRIKQLAGEFRVRLGLDAEDPLLLTAIERAAQLQALAEQAAARALRGDPKVAYDDVVRLSRLADHAMRRLNLDRHKTRPPTLPEYLHEHYPQQTHDDEEGA
jgi:hypothetical protein